MLSRVLPRFDQFRGVWGPSWGPKDGVSTTTTDLTLIRRRSEAANGRILHVKSAITLRGSRNLQSLLPLFEQPADLC